MWLTFSLTTSVWVSILPIEKLDVVVVIRSRLSSTHWHNIEYVSSNPQRGEVLLCLVGNMSK
jgi:hypothetical protein